MEIINRPSLNGLYLLGISILVLSCNEREDSTDILSGFDNVISAKGEILEFNYELEDPNSIEIIDSLLLLGDVKSETYVKVLNLNTRSLLGEFITRGKGPGEVITPFTLRQSGDRSLSILDANSRKTLLFNIDSALSNSSYNAKTHLDFKSIPERITRVDRLKSGYYVGMGLLTEGRYVLIDNNMITGYYLDYPEDGVITSNYAKSKAYQGELFAKENSNRFVSVTKSGGIFEIIDVDMPNNKFEYVAKCHSFYATYSGKGGKTNENKYGYTSVYATNNYIYCVYSGRRISDYLKKLGKEDKIQDNLGFIAEAFLGNKVLIYDWEGNEIAHLKIDYDVKALCVDNQDGILYCLVNTPYPAVYAIDLSGILPASN